MLRIEGLNKKCKEMRIFEIVWTDGELTWISANTNIDAIQCYCETTGFAIEEFEEDEGITEIPFEQWNAYSITGENGAPSKTFYQWMRDNQNVRAIIGETF